MKKRVNSLFVLVMAGMLSFTSCKDNKDEENNESVPMQHEMHQADTDGEMMEDSSNEMAMAEFSNENTKQAYSNYLAIKDALVQTDADAASTAAGQLQESTSEANPEIAELAGKLASEGDVNVQREIFSELTAAMDPVLKEAISSGKIYKQFCPMAFEGKGDYWYASSEEIRNPYFGDKMLKCGRVDETIE